MLTSASIKLFSNSVALFCGELLGRVRGRVAMLLVLPTSISYRIHLPSGRPYTCLPHLYKKKIIIIKTVINIKIYSQLLILEHLFNIPQLVFPEHKEHF